MSQCRCISCHECHGQGTIRVPGYPEWELETCDECRGSGIEEYCSECEFAKEFEDEMP